MEASEVLITELQFLRALAVLCLVCRDWRHFETGISGCDDLHDFIKPHEGHLRRIAGNRSITDASRALVGVVTTVRIGPEEFHASKRVQDAAETERKNASKTHIKSIKQPRCHVPGKTAASPANFQICVHVHTKHMPSIA